MLTRNVCLFVVLLVVVGLIGSSSLQAQSTIGKGIKAGLNLASFNGTGADAIKATTKTGFCVGGFLQFGLSKEAFLQPEVLYVSKGADGSIAGESGTVSVDYLEIPVLIKYKVNPQEKTSFNLFAGPALAFKMSAKISGGGYSQDVSSDVNSTDFSLVFGAGADFGLDNGSITIDARYDLGLSNAPKSSAPVTDVKNGGIMLMVGYMF
jgi:hypothetical protein